MSQSGNGALEPRPRGGAMLLDGLAGVLLLVAVDGVLAGLVYALLEVAFRGGADALAFGFLAFTFLWPVVLLLAGALIAAWLGRKLMPRRSHDFRWSIPLANAFLTVAALALVWNTTNLLLITVFAGGFGTVFAAMILARPVRPVR
jgi:hypothetical protein